MQWLQRLGRTGDPRHGDTGRPHPVARRGRRRPGAGDRPSEGLLFGIWQIAYDTVMPSHEDAGRGSGSSPSARGGVAAVERRLLTRARRSEDPDRMPLAPKLVMAETRGVYAGPVTITVLIPAHNEESCISETLTSLLSQSLPPPGSSWWPTTAPMRPSDSRARPGVDVFETIDNKHKKAGGLNQALRAGPAGSGRQRLRHGDGRRHHPRPGIPGGGCASADRRPGPDGGRWALLRRGRRRPDRAVPAQRVHPLPARHAPASRPGVRADRHGVDVPAAGAAHGCRRARPHHARRPGDVYDTVALTEDNELTLAIKSLGALMISPSECTVVTEVMPTWRALWAQRLRWQRGALENLGAYGLRPADVPLLGPAARHRLRRDRPAAYLLLIAAHVLALDHWVWFPFWVGVGLIFMVERVVTVWRGAGGRGCSPPRCSPSSSTRCSSTSSTSRASDISLPRQASWKHVVQPVRHRCRAR